MQLDRERFLERALAARRQRDRVGVADPARSATAGARSGDGGQRRDQSRFHAAEGGFACRAVRGDLRLGGFRVAEADLQVVGATRFAEHPPGSRPRCGSCLHRHSCLRGRTTRRTPEGAVELLLHASPRHLAGWVGAFCERRFSVHNALEGPIGQRRDRDGPAFERPHPFDRVRFRGGGGPTEKQGGEKYGGDSLSDRRMVG